MTRIVLDTNVFISSIFWRGKPRKVIELAIAGKIQSLTCHGILHEIEEVLTEDFKISISRVNEIIRHIISFSKIVSIREDIRIKIRDIEDVKIINCAKSGNADYIITGDKDLRVLAEIAGVKILTVSEFLEKIKGKK